MVRVVSTYQRLNISTSIVTTSPSHHHTILLLLPVSRVLAPLVQQLNVLVLDVTSLKSLLYDVVVVGESFEAYVSLGKSLSCNREAVCVRSHHAHYLVACLAQSCHSLQRASAGSESSSATSAP